MRHVALGILACGLVALVSAASAAGAAEGQGAFDGEWRTSVGIVTIKQVGSEVGGSFGERGQFTLKGKVDGSKLSFEYQEDGARGDAHWTLDDSGQAFRGGFKVRGGRSGTWDGWRPDPAALDGRTVDLSGLWLTDLGLMELVQVGGNVIGRYALRGTSDIGGTVTGRRFEFTYKSFRQGKGWFDVSPGDARRSFAGAANADRAAPWYAWRGRQAPEFARHANLIAGKIVDGSTTGLLTYAVRAPEGYIAGDAKRWPAVVILHGSNMNGRAYVDTVAATWPDVARDYLLIGMNGERPSSIGDAPRFNYTYVNYVGRSTYKGFPGTDRESPALVAEALEELNGAYPIDRYFVGGHSQGGFLTYSLLMNFPRLVAGAFAVSASVIVQCEPGAYADAKLRAEQRSVPLAILHGKHDEAVGFAAGEYAATVFGESGWPALRFFVDESGAGHRFALLPIGEAIRWLEAHASIDPDKVLDFAEQRMKLSGYRDAVAAVNRARSLAPAAGETLAKRLDRVSRELDARAAAGAERFLPLIRSGESNDWIDGFLTYRDDFEFAPAAQDVMKAFAALRAEHEGPANKALESANTAFRQGRREEGYAKYQEIVARHYAAASYRNVKRWLAKPR